MPTRKRQGKNKGRSARPPTLPADLLLEIAVRSDATTLFRCAATCHLLRRRILSAAFIQQQVIAGVVPQYILACFQFHAHRNKRRHRGPKPLVSLFYPATPTASSFVRKRLAPFVSRRAANLLREYELVTSRRGLVLLRRRHDLTSWKNCHTDLCVYDPMTDVRTFLWEPPPNISMDPCMSSVKSCVLLTVADGIGCSLLLLVAKMRTDLTDRRLGEACIMSVQTSAPSAAGDIRWGPTNEIVCHSGPFLGYRGVVVKPGGVIHWLTLDQKILTYDVRTGKSGTMKYPHGGNHHLAMSSDGRLRILAVEGFMISVWEQLSTGGWSPAATINTEEKVRSMYPNIIHGHVSLNLRRWEEIKSNALLLKINDRITVVLDLETKEMRKQEDPTWPFLFEIDLPARLQAMKVYS